MKNYLRQIILILCLIFVVIIATNMTYAEQSATACFDMGFNAAAKAFNAGDSSAFTPVYGMGKKMFNNCPCCTNAGDMSKGCMAYNAAFQTVQQYGPSKNSVGYSEKRLLFQQLDTGILGF